jgi:DNA-binding HxlR family transcriptional regulator
MRFGQIADSIPAISRKVLTDQLKDLEKNKLVKRGFFAEIPPKLEYSLTERSKKLCSVFKSIEEWMDEN